MEEEKGYGEFAELTAKSREYYEKAKEVIPMGVSSPFRGYPYWTPYPIVLDRGKGSKVWDIDGNEYIDYLAAYGPLVLGQCPPRIIEAAQKQLEKGTMFGTPIELEAKVARKICDMVPCAEMVRFSNTGTEATMHALRISRGCTGKDKIVKFEGGYHGVHDYVMVSFSAVHAGPRIAPNNVAMSWGIPQDTLKTVITLPWNDLEVLEKTVKRRGHEIAAIITEPALCNIGFVPPEEGYLEAMREVTEENDIILIFDEVKTGFNMAMGGAQEFYGVTPDLAVFAKALGSGFPIAAIAGKKKFMDQIAPEKILHAGTYNANSLVLAAADATLAELSANGGAAFKYMNKLRETLQEGHNYAFKKEGADAITQGGGRILALYFTKLKKVREARDLMATDSVKLADFFREMLKRGVLVHPGETYWVGLAHTKEDIEKTKAAIPEALRAIA